MVESKPIVKKLIEFNKTNYLMNIKVNFEDDDNVFLLFYTLTKSFKHFEDTMFYIKERTMTLDEVLINSWCQGVSQV